MPNVKVAELDFSDFPNVLRLKHGIDGSREWYECWRGRKGIVVQRASKTHPFYIFFIEGEAVRTYNTPNIKAFSTIKDAVKELKELGFEVIIESGGQSVLKR